MFVRYSIIELSMVFEVQYARALQIDIKVNQPKVF